ncbi:MAG: acyltransferase domain-containing protein [Azoarcus sp.]|nr:acyltransferase domain-containing protein [Azoarcus sp.]
MCWLCPGQGSQSPDMFGRVAGDPHLAKHLARLTGGLEADAMAIAADDSRCFLNRHAQPLIVLYGLTVAAALDDAGLAPALVAGYSVGELTAHAVAAALAPGDALRLASARAACMDAATPADFGMLAVRGLRLAALEPLAAEAGAVIAIRNGADHAVLAGPQHRLAQLADALSASSSAHIVALRITIPAHSRWLAAGVEPLRAALATAHWHPYRAPVLTALDGQPVSRAVDAVATLARQIAEPLDWARTLDVAVEMGATAFFELGPGSSLTRMVRERFPELQARAFDDFATVDGAVAWLQRQSG